MKAAAVLCPIILLIIFFGGCTEDPFDSPLPSYFPELYIPANNDLTQAKAALGKRLFNDKNMSLDSTIMCASCHKKDVAFADSVSISPGIKNRLGERNTPSLIHAAFSPLINRDGGVIKLDIQALVPIEDHAEMGISIIELTKRLNQDESYVSAFQDAFDRKPDGFTIPRALASYVRSLIDHSSPYDDYLKGDMSALSESAIRGLDLFKSEELACTACHSGALLTNFDFENNGLYETYQDIGRALITSHDTDRGKFKVPSLRNVTVTAPYMHDGSISNLEEVITHYARSGQQHRNKSEHLQGFALTEEGMSDLMSFFDALTSKNLQVL